MKMKEITLLTCFLTLLSNFPFTYFCMAQEATNPQQPSTESEKKSSETPTPRPSLSSLLNQTVIFLYEDKTPQNQQDRDTFTAGEVLGTAFLVGVPSPSRTDRSIPFIVTAKHVIAGRTKVLGRYTNKSGTEPIFVQYDLEDFRKKGDLWEYHNDKGVDLVVFRTLAYEDAKFLPLSINLIASKDTFTQEHIDASDRVMIPCLMANYPGTTQNYPIFRDGSIALITEEPISFTWKLGSTPIKTKQQVIFINSTLNEGFSGAPVFLWPGMRSTPEGFTFGGKPWLLGIVHGFFPQPRQIIDAEGENVALTKPSKEPPDILGQIKPPRNVPIFSLENSAIGIAFPAWRLLEILQSDSVQKRVQQIADEDDKSKPEDKKN